MKKIIYALFVCISILAIACTKEIKSYEASNIPYTEAIGYMVKENYTGSDTTFQITTAENFAAIFQTATATTATPTTISFTNNYVIAVALSAKSTTDTVKVYNLLKSTNDAVLLNYTVSTGQVLTNETYRPWLILLVDKKYLGEIYFQERE